MTADPKKNKSIMVIAGEASGDMHGSSLIREIKKIDPTIDFFGIGGDRMQAEGVRTVRHVNDMSFLGFFEVIQHLPFIRKVYKELSSLLKTERPDALLLIDYPGFNIRFAKEANTLGIPVIYYISPQVWAWKKKRAKTLARRVARMLVLFPFEVDIYKAYGMDVHFVGHPLKDGVSVQQTKASFFKEIGFDPDSPTVGILPGSRKQEIQKLLPEMVDAIPRLKKKIPNLQVMLGTAPTLNDDVYLPIVWQFPDVKMVRGKTYEVMAHSNCVMVASGTATLETALLNTPMVILYKLSRISYWIGRLLVKLSHFGLVNIVAGKGIVTELLQNEVNGKRIAQELFPLLTDQQKIDQIKSELARVSEKLGDAGASKRAAELVVDFLENTN